MTEQELIDTCALLGYNRLWIDYGFLSPEYLLQQKVFFDESGDKNTEHYRYRAFSDYLHGKPCLTDTAFDHYLQLALLDPAPLMAGSALSDLFKSIDLTEQQFDRLSKAILAFGDWAGKIVLRHSLLRKLRTEAFNDRLFRECMEHGDSFVQQKLLNLANREQLEELANQACNRQIRNMAKVELRRLVAISKRSSK